MRRAMPAGMPSPAMMTLRCAGAHENGDTGVAATQGERT